MDNINTLTPPWMAITVVNFYSIKITWYDGLETLAMAGLKCAMEITVKKEDSDNWEVIYVGHAEGCEYDKMEPGGEYSVRARLQCNGQYGPYGEIEKIEMPNEPTSTNEVHRLIRCENHDELATLLENNKVNLESCDQMDYTPLMSAVLKNHKRIVELLLRHEANPNTSNKMGKTAIMLAAHKGFNELINILLKHAAQADLCDIHGMNAMFYAVDGENANAVKILAKSGLDTNQKDYEHGWTPLIRLACLANNGNHRVGEALIACGANVNVQDKYGQTPLIHCAFHKNHTDLAKLLLNSGADPEIRNYKNNSALEIARSLENQNFCGIIERFNKAGRSRQK